MTITRQEDDARKRRRRARQQYNTPCHCLHVGAHDKNRINIADPLWLAFKL